jgi:hypothetical protein
VHGIDEGQAAENIRVPERDAMKLLNEVGVERTEEYAGLDGIGTEEHFIAEDEACENYDGQYKKITVWPMFSEKLF